MVEGPEDKDNFEKAAAPRVEVRHGNGDDEHSPIPNIDRTTYNNYLRRALSGDTDIPAEFLQLARSASLANPSREKSDEWWREVTWLLALEQQTREIGDLIRRYDGMAAQYHERSLAAQRDMKRAADRLREIDGSLDEADAIFADQRRTGKIDRAKAIALLRSRGVEVNTGEDDFSLASKVQREANILSEERTKFASAYQSAYDKTAFFTTMEKECRRQAAELAAKRDQIRNGGLDPRETDLRLRALEGEYQLDVQRKANELERAQATSGTDRVPSQDAEQRIVETSQSDAQDETAIFRLLAKGRLKSDFSASVREDKPAPSDDTKCRVLCQSRAAYRYDNIIHRLDSTAFGILMRKRLGQLAAFHRRIRGLTQNPAFRRFRSLMLIGGGRDEKHLRRQRLS